MAAAILSVMMKPRYILILVNYCSLIIIFQTLLVTGGYSDGDYLSSTELLVGTEATAWVFTGDLPTPRSGLKGANIGNKVLMTGK